MLVQIKFIRSGANSRIGGFSHGDRARVDAAFAAHLVDVAKVAEYVETPAEKPVKKAKK